jgi:hypothetical protein
MIMTGDAKSDAAVKNILSSLGSLLANPLASGNILSQELAEAMDLGLKQRAHNVFRALQFAVHDRGELDR